jgi:DNA integrity scanning protein DisA with diadenylate cyclase activity
MERKRDEKKARKQVEEVKPEVESEEEEDVLDYSSNEEAEMDLKKSLQKVDPRLPRTFEERQAMPRVIVILEHA